MDILLGRVTQQAMNYAIRSGISITAGYAIKQCARLLSEAPRGKAREEFRLLQLRLESKLRIISPAIDMIELIAARGNTSLDSAVSLTRDIRVAMQSLGTRVARAANQEERLRRKGNRSTKVQEEQAEREMRHIIAAINALLDRIEDAVPLINLAITTSGVSLSTNLSGTISPSRLLQASTFLTAADAKYAAQPGIRVPVGPIWTLSVYMLFAGHIRAEGGVREATWKEAIHKARVSLVRVPLEQLYDRPGDVPTSNGKADDDRMPGEVKTAEFAYRLSIIEDLDDDRVHTFEDDQPHPPSADGVENAGIRDVIPVHEISKVFYADTGKILNISGDGEVSHPVLLLKRDVHAEPPRRMLHLSQMTEQSYVDDSIPYGEDHQPNGVDTQSKMDRRIQRESLPNTPDRSQPQVPTPTDQWRLPADLDPEWIAFEVYAEPPHSEESDDDEVNEAELHNTAKRPSLDTRLASTLTRLALHSPSPSSETTSSPSIPTESSALSLLKSRSAPQIKTTLSLLEMLLKLTALQQFRQESHLSIEDELINFFLEDSATAGLGPDKAARQRLRHTAVRRVGFDPYDESPIKRRGEEYISHVRDDASPRPDAQLSPSGEQWQTQRRSIHDVGLDRGHHSSPFRETSPAFAEPQRFHRAQMTSATPSPQHVPLPQTPSSQTSTPIQNGTNAGESEPLTPPSLDVTRAGGQPKPPSRLSREWAAAD